MRSSVIESPRSWPDRPVGRKPIGEPVRKAKQRVRWQAAGGACGGRGRCGG